MDSIILENLFTPYMKYKKTFYQNVIVFPPRILGKVSRNIYVTKTARIISQEGKKHYSLTNIRPFAETAKIKRLQGLVARGI
jgi:hypothetical protein